MFLVPFLGVRQLFHVLAVQYPFGEGGLRDEVSSKQRDAEDEKESFAGVEAS